MRPSSRASRICRQRRAEPRLAARGDRTGARPRARMTAEHVTQVRWAAVGFGRAGWEIVRAVSAKGGWSGSFRNDGWWVRSCRLGNSFVRFRLRGVVGSGSGREGGRSLGRLRGTASGSFATMARGFDRAGQEFVRAVRLRGAGARVRACAWAGLSGRPRRVRAWRGAALLGSKALQCFMGAGWSQGWH